MAPQASKGTALFSPSLPPASVFGMDFVGDYILVANPSRSTWERYTAAVVFDFDCDRVWVDGTGAANGKGS